MVGEKLLKYHKKTDKKNSEILTLVVAGICASKIFSFFLYFLLFFNNLALMYVFKILFPNYKLCMTYIITN